MHCFSVVFSVLMHGALVSVSVLWRLRSCRHIIIIIVIISGTAKSQTHD